MNNTTRYEGVFLDFNRKQIHPNTFGMLKNICQEEDIHKTLTNMQNGRGLTQNKAQQLCIRLLQIMTKDNWQREEETNDQSQNEHNQNGSEDNVQESSHVEGWNENTEENSNQTQNQSPDLTLSQMRARERSSMEDQEITFEPQPGTSGGEKGEKTKERSNSDTKDPKKWDKSTPIC